jgi:hypothetical protein
MLDQVDGEVEAELPGGGGGPVDPEHRYRETVGVGAIGSREVQAEDGRKENPLVLVVGKAREGHEKRVLRTED